MCNGIALALHELVHTFVVPLNIDLLFGEVTSSLTLTRSNSCVLVQPRLTWQSTKPLDFAYVATLNSFDVNFSGGKKILDGVEAVAPALSCNASSQSCWARARLASVSLPRPCTETVIVRITITTRELKTIEKLFRFMDYLVSKQCAQGFSLSFHVLNRGNQCYADRSRTVISLEGMRIRSCLH